MREVSQLGVTHCSISDFGIAADALKTVRIADFKKTAEG